MQLFAFFTSGPSLCRPLLLLSTSGLLGDVVKGYADVWASTDFTRGEFRPIDATRIDLPPIPACTSSVWIPLLPVATQRLFLSRSGSLLGNFDEQVTSNFDSLPPSRVSAISGHYARIISRACLSGMIVCSDVDSESPEQRRLDDLTTVSSFAVCKDADSDRVISWPRFQNSYFLQPPDVDLPHPGVLA